MFWQIHIWSWFPMIFFPSDMKFKSTYKVFWSVGDLFPWPEGKKPKPWTKSKIKSRKKQLETPTHHTVAYHLTTRLRIINCTNRIISMSQENCVPVWKNLLFFKNISLWISQKMLFEKSPYGTVLGKNYDLWQTLTCPPSEKNINSVFARVRSE